MEMLTKVESCRGRAKQPSVLIAAVAVRRPTGPPTSTIRAPVFAGATAIFQLATATTTRVVRVDRAGEVVLGPAAAFDVQADGAGVARADVDGLAVHRLLREAHVHAVHRHGDVVFFVRFGASAAAAAVGSALLAAALAAYAVGRFGREQRRRG